MEARSASRPCVTTELSNDTRLMCTLSGGKRSVTFGHGWGGRRLLDSTVNEAWKPCGVSAGTLAAKCALMGREKSRNTSQLAGEASALLRIQRRERLERKREHGGRERRGKSEEGGKRSGDTAGDVPAVRWSISERWTKGGRWSGPEAQRAARGGS